jgi:hypothetical protein
MVMTSPSKRFTWDPAVSGGVLVIPGRTDVVVAVFLSIFLAMWSVGVLAVWQFLAQPDLFFAVWLLVWGAVECVVVAALGYILAGREVITLSPRMLSIRLEILGAGHTWEYDVAAVRTLRQLRQQFLPQGRSHRPGLLAGFACGISFNYRAYSVGFGRGLDEAEAREVVAVLLATGILPGEGVDVSLYTG